MQPRLLKRLLISAALVLSIAAPAAGQPTAGRNDAGREATRRVDRFGDPLPSGAIARLGTLRDYIGFESGDVVLSPDGKTVTATSTFFDIPLKLWDVSTGQVTLELKELDPALRDGGIVRRAAFSPDGKLLAAGDALGTVRIGRTDTGRKVLEFPGVVPVAHLRFLSGGKLLAATDIRGTTRILPIGPREKIRTFTHRDRPVGSLQEFRARFRSPDGKLQAYFSRDGRDLLVRDVSRSREVRRFPYLRRTRGEIDETWESHIVFSPDSKLLAAGDTPASLCLWSLETGQAYRRFPHQDAGHGIAFTPDGKQLITGGMHFRYWDIVKGQEVRRFPKQSEVRAVAFGPKGETLVTADDATVRLWETSTGRPLRQYLGHRADVFEVAIDPDGKFLASGDVEGTLILWDFSSGKELRRRVQPAPVAASGEGGLRYPEIPSIAFSPDGKTLAATDHAAPACSTRFPAERSCAFLGSIGLFAISPSPRMERRSRPFMDTGSCYGMWRPGGRSTSSIICKSSKPRCLGPKARRWRRWIPWAASAFGTWLRDDECATFAVFVLRTKSGRAALRSHFCRTARRWRRRWTATRPCKSGISQQASYAGGSKATRAR